LAYPRPTRVDLRRGSDLGPAGRDHG